jgi:putative inorganic carbon (HCO3(-)) transporter
MLTGGVRGVDVTVVGWRPASAARRWNVWSVVAWACGVLGIGLAVALPEPLLLVLGAAGALAGVLTFIQPLVAVPLLLLAVPFGSLGRATADATTAAPTVAEPSVGAVEVLVAVLGVAWVARGVRRRELNVYAAPIILAILAMVGLAAVSIGYAEDRISAVKESLKWLELLLVVLVVVDLVRSQAAALWLVGALFLAGSAEAAYGAFQFATGSGPDSFAVQGSLRAFGHFDQPNPFAGYLTTMFPAAVLMLLTAANPLPFRLYALAATLLIGGGIGLSQSRGAWLGGLIAFAVLVVLWSRTTRRLVVPGLLAATFGVCLAVTGLLPPAVLDRVAQTIEYFGIFDVRTVQATTENWAVVERMAHWQAGWLMFMDHPWLGVGAGNYAQAYPFYFVPGWPEALGHAHNYYLNILAELGVVGGGILVLMLGIAFHRLAGVLAHSEDLQRTFWRALLAGCVGGLVVFCVHNMFDSLFVHSVNVQIGVLLGLGLVAANQLRPT